MLLLFGLVYILTGIAQILTESNAAVRSYKAHTDLLPLTAWGWVFVGTGLLALAATFTRLQRAVGFGALVVMSLAWSLEFFVTWLSTGYGRAIVGGLSWGCLAGVLWLCAGWADPIDDDGATEQIKIRWRLW